MKLIILLPAYNEQDKIEKVIKEIPPNICQETKIIVINDGSTDKTKEKAEKAGAKVISHKRNLGLAKTFKTGIKESLKLDADIIVHIDADGQYDPQDIPKLIQPIINSEADLVLGSRFLGKIEEMPKIKSLGNRLYSWLLRKLTKTNISDFQTGFRAFNKKVAQRITIRSKYTYTQEMLIDCILKGFRIKEIPIIFAKRTSGESRLMSNSFSYAYKSSKTLFKTMRDFRPIFFFGIFGLIFTLSGLGMLTYNLYLYFVDTTTNDPLFMFSAVFILLGIQSLFFGFLGDMLITIRKDISKIK